MAIYDANGDDVTSAFNVNGESITSAYDLNGDNCFNTTLGYYESVFEDYVNTYIKDHGLIVDGKQVTKDELREYLLNRNNCIYRGKLAKSGQRLVDKNGDSIDLQGIGTHHLLQYHNLHTYDSLKALKYCGINCIRMSAYPNDHYFTYSDGELAVGYRNDPTGTFAEMDHIIDCCIDLGLYAIADWHVWSGGGERLYTSDACGFFEHFANKYHDCDNVLYELANEAFYDSLADFVTHCKETSAVIKTYVDDPILICGTRNANDGTSELYNALLAENITDIFISQHRYSGNGSVSAFETMWDNGIPLFVTEWSNTSSSTSSTSGMNVVEGNAFLEFFNTNHIPNCIWKFTDQTMAYSVMANRGLIDSEYYSSGVFLEGDFTLYGKFFFDRYGSFAFSEGVTS